MLEHSNAIRDDVRSFLIGLCGFDGFADDDHLAATGVVRSLHLIELVTFVEDRFAVAVCADDVYQGHFASVRTIVDFVTRARP